MQGDGGARKNRPKVLFLGPRNAGKASIIKVVFEKMAPSDTLFIERTSKHSFHELNAFLALDVCDLPPPHLQDEALPSFEQYSAVVFVLDGQSEYHNLVPRLARCMHKVYEANAQIQFEIFMHKMDGMSSDYRLDNLQNLRDRLAEDLFDLSPVLESSMHVFYHLTSVFDSSIYEALSRVIQKLIPEQAALERLLDLLCQQCLMDKAFLFDTSSRLYIATDSAPLAHQTYEICSEYIDLVGDLSALYEPGLSSSAASAATSGTHTRSHSSSSLASSAHGVAGGQFGMTPLTPRSNAQRSSSSDRATEAPSEVQGYPRLPSSHVTLGTGGAIAMWTMDGPLALVALLRPHALDKHEALIEYNVSLVRAAVLDIFALELSPPSS